MALGLGGKSDVFEACILKLLFNNVSTGSQTPAVGIGDAAGIIKSTADGNLYVALHTADPFSSAETNDQTASEISYTGSPNYARQAVVRTTSGWTVATASGTTTVKPVAAITFSQMTGGTGGTVTHASVGVNASGASTILYCGPVTPNISVVNGVTPSLATTSAIEEG